MATDPESPQSYTTPELTPDVIRSRRFSTTDGGYAPAQVDDFLEQVASAMEVLLTKPGPMAVKAETQRLHEMSARIIDAAQDYAQKAREETAAEAREILEDAKRLADEMRSRSREHSERNTRHVDEVRRTFVQELRDVYDRVGATLYRLEQQPGSPAPQAPAAAPEAGSTPSAPPADPAREHQPEPPVRAPADPAAEAPQHTAETDTAEPAAAEPAAAEPAAAESTPGPEPDEQQPVTGEAAPVASADAEAGSDESADSAASIVLEPEPATTPDQPEPLVDLRSFQDDDTGHAPDPAPEPAPEASTDPTATSVDDDADDDEPKPSQPASWLDTTTPEIAIEAEPAPESATPEPAAADPTPAAEPEDLSASGIWGAADSTATPDPQPAWPPQPATAQTEPAGGADDEARAEALLSDMDRMLGGDPSGTPSPEALTGLTADWAAVHQFLVQQVAAGSDRTMVETYLRDELGAAHPEVLYEHVLRQVSEVGSGPAQQPGDALPGFSPPQPGS